KAFLTEPRPGSRVSRTTTTMATVASSSSDRRSRERENSSGSGSAPSGRIFGCGSCGRALERCLRQQLHLIGIARGGEADHLVRAGLLEAGQVALEGLGVGGRRPDDHVGGLLAKPGVVVAEPLAGLV